MSYQKYKILPVKPEKINDTDKNKVPHHLFGHNKKPFLLTIYGPVRSGKSVILNNILYSKVLGFNYFSKIIIFSPTVEIDSSMRYINEDVNITKITGEDIDEMEDLLKLIIEDQKHNDEPILIIIDDLIDKLRGKVLSNLCTRYRHYKISLILTTQYYKGVSPIIRNNSSHWILYKSHLDKEKMKIEEDFNSYSQFLEYYKEATNEKYHFLYINQEKRELWADFINLLYQDE